MVAAGNALRCSVSIPDIRNIIDMLKFLHNGGRPTLVGRLSQPKGWNTGRHFGEAAVPVGECMLCPTF